MIKSQEKPRKSCFLCDQKQIINNKIRFPLETARLIFNNCDLLKIVSLIRLLHWSLFYKQKSIVWKHFRFINFFDEKYVFFDEKHIRSDHLDNNETMTWDDLILFFLSQEKVLQFEFWVVGKCWLWFCVNCREIGVLTAAWLIYCQ